jgi:hypothetical protein
MKTKLTSIIILALFINQLHAGNFDDSNIRSTIDKHYTLSTKKHSGGREDSGIKGKIMITAGVGFNILGTNLVVQYDLSSAYSNSSFSAKGSSVPMINVGVDYGILRFLSAGVSFGYQTATVTSSDGVFTFVDSWKRIHFAARADYYMVKKENVSLYAGLKFGYNIYSMTSNYTAIDPNYTANLGVAPSPVSAQVHFGFSYYFKGIVGFNTEIGIGYGGPYMAAVGLAVKI